MSKTKYKYNQDKLTYEVVKPTFKQLLLKVSRFFLFSLLFATGIVFLFVKFYGSPKEKMLQREIDQYELQYRIINDRLSQMDAVVEDLQNRDDNIYRVIFEAEPIASEIRNGGYGGVKKYASIDGYKNSEVIIPITKKLDNLANKLYVQSNSFNEVFELARKKEEMLAHIPAIQPISNKDLTRTASGWGFRIHPVYKTRKFHKGIDFTAPIGTEIYSTGDGVVLRVERSRYGFGNLVTIDHGYGYQTLYAHLSGFNVHKGQKIKRGDIIAYVGNTGTSTGPHLHYEVHYKKKAINPSNYFFQDLGPEEYEEIIRIASSFGQSYD